MSVVGNNLIHNHLLRVGPHATQLLFSAAWERMTAQNPPTRYLLLLLLLHELGLHKLYLMAYSLSYNLSSVGHPHGVVLVGRSCIILAGILQLVVPSIVG